MGHGWARIYLAIIPLQLVYFRHTFAYQPLHSTIRIKFHKLANDIQVKGIKLLTWPFGQQKVKSTFLLSLFSLLNQQKNQEAFFFSPHVNHNSLDIFLMSAAP